MKKTILVAFVFVFSFAGVQERSIKDIISITKNTDGKYDVVCGDNTTEMISEHDIMINNLCPFIAYDPNRVDILFVVDDSGSMGVYQQKLALHAGLIAEKLNLLGYDYQIAVTTTDADNKSSTYINNSGYEVITKDTPNIKLALEQNFDVGTSGSGTEQGFLQSQQALQSYLNGSFYRTNSKLHIVFVGDEGDQSNVSAQAFKDFLEKLTLSTALEKKFEVTVVNAFTEECRNVTGAFNGVPVKELELLGLVGGKQVNICDKVFDLF